MRGGLYLKKTIEKEIRDIINIFSFACSGSVSNAHFSSDRAASAKCLLSDVPRKSTAIAIMRKMEGQQPGYLLVS